MASTILEENRKENAKSILTFNYIGLKMRSSPSLPPGICRHVEPHESIIQTNGRAPRDCRGAFKWLRK